MRLLQERIARRAGGGADRRRLSGRLAGLGDRGSARPRPSPPARRPDQARCLLSWQSFAEPADPSQVTDVYDAIARPGGVAARGIADALHQPADRRARRRRAGAERNLGTLVPNEEMTEARASRRGAVPARCDVRGFLLIGDNDALPEMGPYVLPGNNYHVYDYALFWANIRADAERPAGGVRAAR